MGEYDGWRQGRCTRDDRKKNTNKVGGNEQCAIFTNMIKGREKDQKGSGCGGDDSTFARSSALWSPPNVTRSSLSRTGTVARDPAGAAELRWDMASSKYALKSDICFGVGRFVSLGGTGKSDRFDMRECVEAEV